MIKDRTFGSIAFDVLNHAFLGIAALMCLFPLVHILAVSLSDRAATTANLVTFWPINLNTLNYEQILRQSQFQRSFLVSLLRVGLGVPIYMAVIILTAYPLSLNRGFPGQRPFKWFLIFAMLFSGGLIPWYLAIRNLGLLDSIWALVLPGAVATFYIIVMLNFFRQLPEELSEAATVDGASHWQILVRIYLPLSLPAIATLVLFASVDHWNAWFDALVLMKTPDKYPLQTYLQSTIVAGDYSKLLTDPRIAAKLSERSMRAAQVFLATVPILLVYPFLQRYFVSGLTLGSVKG